jgi:salicylate hydroxylase
MLDHPPAPTYYSGNIAILGDAAHAMTPWQGAGGGQAIEDSVVLAALLGQVRRKEHFTHAIAAYDAVRRPRSQKVVSTSRETLGLYALNDGVANGDSDEWLGKWNGRLDWIWKVDIAKQNDEALALFFQSIGAAAGWNNRPLQSHQRQSQL